MSVYFITREEAQKRLDEMLGCTIEFAGKSPDTELYIFEFSDSQDAGEIAESTEERCIFKLHLLCRFKVIWRKRRITDTYYEDTSSEAFASQASQLMGQPIKRTGLSDKNDLWLDFGDFWMVFATFENDEESWRFFYSDKKKPHLVASDTWLKLVY